MIDQVGSSRIVGTPSPPAPETAYDRRTPSRSTTPADEAIPSGSANWLIGSVSSPVSSGYLRISKMMLSGVCAAIRNRVNPAAVTTSRILAGPACVPSARPTSWDSDAGVQSSVENP